jgi:hypothetical protein
MNELRNDRIKLCNIGAECQNGQEISNYSGVGQRKRDQNSKSAGNLIVQNINQLPKK